MPNYLLICGVALGAQSQILGNLADKQPPFQMNPEGTVQHTNFPCKVYEKCGWSKGNFEAVYVEMERGHEERDRERENDNVLQSPGWGFKRLRSINIPSHNRDTAMLPI